MQLVEPTANTLNQGQVLRPLTVQRKVSQTRLWDRLSSRSLRIKGLLTGWKAGPTCSPRHHGATRGVVLAKVQAEAPRQWWLRNVRCSMQLEQEATVVSAQSCPCFFLG